MADAKIKISAEDAASKVLAQVRGSMEDVEKASGALTSALGLIGVAGVGGLTMMFRNIVDGIDAMNDLKDATGASIGNISALEDVAIRTGTSFDTVGTSLLKFNQALNDTDPDSKISQALKAIGLSAKDLKSEDPAEALRKTAVALAGFADDGNKARLTQILFGKSTKEVAAFMKDLGEQTSLVAKVTAAQTDAAEAFNKQLFQLEKNSIDAGRSLVSTLLPSILEMVQEMEAGIRIAGGFSNAIMSIGTANPFATAGENLKAYSKELADLEERKAKDGSPQYPGEGADLDAGIKKAKIRIAYFKELQTNATLLNTIEGQRLDSHDQSATKNSVGDLGKGKDKSKASTGLTEAQTALASYVKGLESQVTTLGKVSEEQKALNFLQSIGVTGQVPQVRELVLGLADQVQGLKDSEEAQKQLNKAQEESSKYFDTLSKEIEARAKENESLRQHESPRVSWRPVGLSQTGIAARLANCR